MGSVARIVGAFAPSQMPLFFANWSNYPALCLAGQGLSVALSAISIDRAKPIAANFNPELEKAALASIVVTSSTNRIIRIALGSCHLLGAILYNYQLSKKSSMQNSTSVDSRKNKANSNSSSSSVTDSESESESALTLTGKSVALSIGRWALTFAMCAVAAVWITTGSYGQ